MFLRFRFLFSAAAMILASIPFVFGQTATPTPAASPSPTPTPAPAPAQKFDIKNITAEQVVEISLLSAYAFGSGRPLLNQIRKTTAERGRVTYTAADGKIEQASYQRFILRADALDKERIRLDQEFPNARYSLVWADEKIFGLYNNTVFTPREDAAKTFENNIFRGLEAFLRYKENGSTIEMGPREKVMGVDFYTIDITDTRGRKTRFYVSTKLWRVMMLTYEDGGVKYRRKFYDYKNAQGTLVPFKTVLWADDKIIEETEIGTITFGQKVDEELFKAG